MSTLIIAEAGVNHNGDLSLAKKLVIAAATAGADIVKFQTFKADKLVSRTARKADYQASNINDGDDSQYAMLKLLEMPDEWHKELMALCDVHCIKFLSTGFDEESVDFLERLGSPLYKVPSGELTNLPYLRHVARKGKPVILSTGMATLSEVQAAIEAMEAEGLQKSMITVLHCNTEYPTPFEDVNLRAMAHLRDKLHVNVGYSDHTMGIEVPIAAVALGARVIEKHFTLDRTMPGPDHLASLEPEELTAMVKAIRNIEKAVAGSGLKEPSRSESRNTVIARKSVHLRVAVVAGTVLEPWHLIMRRPGDGISPMEIDRLIGKRVGRDLEPDTKLEWEMILS